MALGEENPAFELQTIFYSDTSNMAYQILCQNSRCLKKLVRNQEVSFRTLDPDRMRAKIVYTVLLIINEISDENRKNKLADLVASLTTRVLFGCYKQICYFLESLANYPSNFFLISEIKKLGRKMYSSLVDQTLQTPADLKEEEELLQDRGITLDREDIRRYILKGNAVVSDKELRHQFISMNDYVRKNDKVVTIAIDDDMVVIEMQKYFKEQTEWLERSRFSLCRGRKSD